VPATAEIARQRPAGAASEEVFATTAAAAAPILLSQATAERVRAILVEGTSPATSRAHAGDVAYFWAWAGAELGLAESYPVPLAALVQFVGTLFFNVTTFTGMKHGFSVHQSNARVWAPDAFGSIAFLISSELAYAEVCHRWVGWQWSSLSWRIVALNLLGSIAFGVSAVASFVEPATGEPLSAHLANGGTSLGGLCFLVGALLLMPEAAAEERANHAEPDARQSVSLASP